MQIVPKPVVPSPAVVSPSVPPLAAASAPLPNYRKPLPFRERSLSLPIVVVNESPGGFGLVKWLTVGYLPDGKGPEILTDGNLKPESLASLQAAVTTAVTAVGIDPKYIWVRLLVPVNVDGPSAGGMYAVGIASALLGDRIRRDVCMSGTIEPTLEIKPVGRLTDKMYACKVSIKRP